MEVLDPHQNKKFKDEFLDIEIDLSNVLFICTANTLDTIFPPLLDRLERIEVNGYTLHEKKEIFRRFLLSKAQADCGLTLPENSINLTPDALNHLIDGYCREAGVRSLDQTTRKICQKVARRYV
jgi:ATP-dependent Lon protease